MKRAAFFLCILVTLTAPCFPAQAEPFTGGPISVDVPEGWTPSFKKNDPDELALRAPGDHYRLVVLAGPSNGMNSEQGARMLARTLEGSMPEPASKHPNMYTFAAYAGALRCMVVAQGTRMVVLMESGNPLPFEEDIARITRSLASTDADEQAIFDSLKLLYP